MILQLCPWQTSSRQEVWEDLFELTRGRRNWSRKRGQGDWEGRRGQSRRREGPGNTMISVFMSRCKDLPADMKPGRSFVVNHLRKGFCPFFPTLQLLDPTVSVLPCFRHIPTARTLPACPALFSSVGVFLLPDFP